MSGGAHSCARAVHRHEKMPCADIRTQTMAERCIRKAKAHSVRDEREDRDIARLKQTHTMAAGCLWVLRHRQRESDSVSSQIYASWTPSLPKAYAPPLLAAAAQRLSIVMGFTFKTPTMTNLCARSWSFLPLPRLSTPPDDSVDADRSAANPTHSRQISLPRLPSPDR